MEPQSELVNKKSHPDGQLWKLLYRIANRVKLVHIQARALSVHDFAAQVCMSVCGLRANGALPVHENSSGLMIRPMGSDRREQNWAEHHAADWLSVQPANCLLCLWSCLILLIHRDCGSDTTETLSGLALVKTMRQSVLTMLIWPLCFGWFSSESSQNASFALPQQCNFPPAKETLTHSLHDPKTVWQYY